MPNPQQGISFLVSLYLICFLGLSNNGSISHFSKISNSPFPSAHSNLFIILCYNFLIYQDDIIYFLIFQPFFIVLFKYNPVSHIFYKKYPLLKIPFPLWVPPSTHAASGFIPARAGKGNTSPQAIRPRYTEPALSLIEQKGFRLCHFSSNTGNAVSHTLMRRIPAQPLAKAVHIRFPRTRKAEAFASAFRIPDELERRMGIIQPLPLPRLRRLQGPRPFRRAADFQLREPRSFHSWR